MQRHLLVALVLSVFACGGSQAGDSTPAGPAGGGADRDDDSASTEATTDEPRGKRNDAGEFAVNQSDKASRPKQGSLKATETEAAVRFFVIDKNDQAGIPGILIALTSPSGKKYYTGETNADGFAEVLVPIGQTYEVVYLSLGRRDIAAKVKVASEPNLNLKLTMRYQRYDYPAAVPAAPDKAEAPAVPEKRFVLGGVEFETGKATLTKDSYARLEPVVEYMTHKTSARIEISGHTDNVGKPKNNMKLSQARAEAVKKYLVSKGIDGSRIDAVGYGDERPIASNDTKDGRQKNRRIEAAEK